VIVDSIWKWPIAGRQQLAGTAGALSFVGGAGDFDSRGLIAHANDLPGQIPGTMRNLAAALAIEGCALADIVRLKVFYKSDGTLNEGGLLAALAKHFPDEPLPAITLHPTPLQPFTGQSLQAQAIAKRGWRQGEFRVASADAPASQRAGLGGRKLTLALRAGEFIAVPARTAIDEMAADQNGKVLAAGDGPEQTRIAMSRLQESLQAVGASLQDAIKKEGYYFGTTQDQWAAMAKVRASHFREPGPVATVVPCHALWPQGALTKIEVLAMRESWNGFDKYIPREDRWPKRVWDWPVPLPYRQAIRLRDQIWLGGQVPWATNSNAGNVVLAGQVLPQTQFTMSYLEDLLGAFGKTTADLKLMVAYFTSGGSEAESQAFVETLAGCIAGPLPPLTLVPQPHMHTSEMTVEIWGIARG
jgi:enamine deaminase RidA (YjgF/YER057c/UK114 family)